MRNIRRQVRQAHHSGSWVYAIVEGVHLGYATVKLVDGGSRITNLPITGGTLDAGDVAIVDYSAGTPPTVRPTTIVAEELVPDPLELAPIPQPSDAQDLFFTSGDHGLKICQNNPPLTQVGLVTETPIRFDTTIWDTDEFFDINNPEEITIVAPGIYYVIVDVGFSICTGIGNLGISVDGDTFGNIAYEVDYPVSSASASKIMQATGTGMLVQDEKVTVSVFQSVGTGITLVQQTNKWPRFTMQWMGFHEE